MAGLECLRRGQGPSSLFPAMRATQPDVAQHQTLPTTAPYMRLVLTSFDMRLGPPFQTSRRRFKLAALRETTDRNQYSAVWFEEHKFVNKNKSVYLGGRGCSLIMQKLSCRFNVNS